MTELTLLRQVAERLGTSTYQELLPGFCVGRLAETAEPVPMIYEPMVCLVLSGAKRLYIGDSIIEYGEGQHFISMVDIPVTARIFTSASRGSYVALVLRLDPITIAEIASRIGSPDVTASPQNFCVSAADPFLLDAWRRLLELVDRPEEIAFIAPLIEREILFRLLRGPDGPTISRIATADAGINKIRSIAAWIRTHYADAVSIELLAERANMSITVFHRRFKQVMKMSPIQYQKQVRLFEARSRLMASRQDAAGIAYWVGYESASQFSREYKRQFGLSPREDLARTPTIEGGRLLV